MTDFVKAEVDSEEVVTRRLIVSNQALVVAFAGLVFSIVVSYVLQMMFHWGFLVGVLILPVFLLAAYTMNCVVVGNCIVWAWILTAIYVFKFVITLSIFLPRMKSLHSILKKNHH